jgi:hypothetical protein
MSKSNLKIYNNINDIISLISDYGVDYDSKTDDNFPLKNTRIRFISYNESQPDKKYIEIMIGRFVISRVWNDRIEFTLPLPINEYFRVTINGFVMKACIRIIDYSTKLEVSTDALKYVASTDIIFNEKVQGDCIGTEVKYNDDVIIQYKFESKKDRSVSIEAVLPRKYVVLYLKVMLLVYLN